MLSEWSRVRLSSVAYFQEGPGLRNWLYRQAGMPFINIRCINNGKLDLSAVQYIDLDTAEEKYAHFFLQEDDTVLSSSGTLGRMAVVRKEDLPLMLNTSVIRFRTLDELSFDTKFMRYCLLSEDFQLQIQRESQGSAQANFGPSHLMKVSIPLPPLPEQCKIAAILSSVDEAIQATLAVIEQTRRVKEGLLQELLTKGIGHTRFKQTEIGEIPEEWEVGRLGELSPRLAGRLVVQPHRFFAEQGVPIVFGRNIRPGQILVHELRRISFEADLEHTNCRVRAGDLLTIRVGVPGTTAVVPQELDGCHFASAMWISQSPSFSSEWLCQCMNSNLIRRQIKWANYGSVQTQFNIGDAENFLLPTPPIEEQQLIASRGLVLDEVVFTQTASLDTLQSLKAGLLQDLLTGKVRVAA